MIVLLQERVKIIVPCLHTKTLIVDENCQFPIADLALKKENLKLTLKSEIKILLPYKKANISC